MMRRDPSGQQTPSTDTQQEQSLTLRWRGRQTLLTSLLKLSVSAALILGGALPLSAQLQIASPDASDERPDEIEAPYSLTTQDGTGLKLVELDAQTVIDGPLAFTELKLTFLNPHPRQIEGRFEVTMPDRAALSRFAMKIKGAWMEGEVVEKQAARRAYEDALHRRQDPALLEQDAGNKFRARVFPIAPRERKELIISWSQELSDAREQYRLPLVGLPEIERLSLSALIAKPQGAQSSIWSSLGGSASRYETTRVTKEGFKPDRDWTLNGGDVQAIVGARSGDIALARVQIPEVKLEQSVAPHMIVLFDTSASRMIGFEARVKRLERLLARSGELGVTALSLIAFDQDSEVIFTGSPQDLEPRVFQRLVERDALGASDLRVGLAALQSALTDAPKLKRRALLMSDGVFTDGPSNPSALQALLKDELAPLGVSRVDAFVDQTTRDLVALEAVVTASGFKPGKVITREMKLDEQVSRLKLNALDPLKVEIPGARWTWPSELKGMQPGDQALIFADLPSSEPLRVSLNSSSLSEPFSFKIEARDADPALLERAWVRARIERLSSKMESNDPDMKGVWRDQIIKLSTKHRVLSPYTALVVLESEAMYARFGIDRRALSDILTVGATGLKVLKRDQIVLARDEEAERAAKRAEEMRSARERLVAEREMRRREKRKTSRRAPRRATNRAPSGAASGAMSDRLLNVEDAAPEPSDMSAQGLGAIGARSVTRSSASASAPTSAPMPASAEAPAPAPPPSAAPTLMDAPMEESGSEITVEVGGSSAGRAGGSSARRSGGGEGRGRRRARRPRRRPAATSPSRRSRLRRSARRARDRARRPEPKRPSKPALTGVMAEIAAHIDQDQPKRALKRARAWRRSEPTNLLTLIALGKALKASGDRAGAARAFGSVIDFYPSRADMRRLAGNWLEWVGEEGAELAESTYKSAAEQRPDHPSVYHMRAMSLVKLKRYEEALKVVLGGLKARWVANRFRGVRRILKEDAVLIATSWRAEEPKRVAEIQGILKRAGISAKLKEKMKPTMRFILSWETDANDVDFHIYDARGGHAYYSSKRLKSGGELYADITTGYGPECFTIVNPKAAPYKLQAHYYRRGPMGYGAAKLQIIRQDRRGRLTFEERPFVIMVDGAYIDLGRVK